MKRFVINILLFMLPFGLLVLNYTSFENSGGDLNRIGKISVENNYRDKFKKELALQKTFHDLSELPLEKEKDTDILTIGDSFSQQNNFGYQNYLSTYHNINITNMNEDVYNTDHSIQLLYSMANGDIFEKWNVKYVILQSTERVFVLRGLDIDRDKICTINNFDKMYRNKDIIYKINPDGIGIFQNILNYSFYNILYNFNNRAFFSQVYKMGLNKKLFSSQSNDLLFYYDDIENIRYSNPDLISKVNDELNILSGKLKEKGVTLIFLLCPDKYDIYYNFIVNNTLPKNNFYKYLDKEKKDYLYVDAKNLLLKHIQDGEQDVYFADDTHWSPIGTKIVSEGIYKLLKEL